LIGNAITLEERGFAMRIVKTAALAYFLWGLLDYWTIQHSSTPLGLVSWMQWLQIVPMYLIGGLGLGVVLYMIADADANRMDSVQGFVVGIFDTFIYMVFAMFAASLMSGSLMFTWMVLK
jgi:hypothetical protein